MARRSAPRRFLALALSALVTVLALSTIAIAQAPPTGQIAQTTRSPREEANQLLTGGIRLFQSGQFQTAMQNWQRAYTLYLQLKDPINASSALNNLGIGYRALGQPAKAIASHEEALRLAQTAGDLENQADAISGLGAAYITQSQYQEGIRRYEQVLPIRRKLGDRQGEMNTLNNLGIAYSDLGEMQKSEQLYQQALAIARQLRDQQGESNALNNLGINAVTVGQYAQAIDLFQQSLQLCRQLKNPPCEASLLNQLGTVHKDLGEYNQAAAYHRQALKIQQQLGDPVGESSSLGSLGNLYLITDRPAEARQYYEQDLALQRQMGRPRAEAIVLHNLASTYRKLGQPQQAQQLLQQALQISKRIGDRDGESAGLETLAALNHDRAQYTEAIPLFQQALTLRRRIQDRPGEARVLSNLGETYFDAGNLKQAETQLFAAVAILESLRTGLTDAQKVSLFETQRRTYTVLQKVLIQQRKHGQALEVAERGRARAFVDLLASRIERSTAAKTAAAQAAPTLAQIQAVAQSQRATLVEYSLIDNRWLYIWVVSPQGALHFRQVEFQFKDPYSDRQTGQTRSSKPPRFRADPNPTRMQPQLSQLYSQLIAPIAELLPTDPEAQIIFIPQGFLFLVPFPALQTANGTYLIQQHTLSTAPSIQVLQLTQRLQQQRVNLTAKDAKPLVVGNPAPMPKDLAPLPNAEQEAISIAQMLKVEPLLGAQATRSAILPQLSKAALIHLATHGLFNEVQGLQSAIALATSGADNGLLTAADILDLQLQANLVVLSACDTGRGNVTGDGVIGLSRSLITAGVPSVVVSLWAVPDKPTAALMVDFYRNLQQTPNKARSLRQTMLSTMQRYPNPINWAAFTLIGAN